MYTVLSYTLVWPLVGMAHGAVRDFERQSPGRTSITRQSLAESPKRFRCCWRSPQSTSRARMAWLDRTSRL